MKAQPSPHPLVHLPLLGGSREPGPGLCLWRFKLDWTARVCVCVCVHHESFKVFVCLDDFALANIVDFENKHEELFLEADIYAPSSISSSVHIILAQNPRTVLL